MANNLRFVANTHPLPRPDPLRGRLIAAAGSARPDESPLAAARGHLGRLDTGLAKESALHAAVATRLTPLRPATDAPTLQQLVERGRALLHRAQAEARSAELDASLSAVRKLADALRGDA